MEKIMCIKTRMMFLLAVVVALMTISSIGMAAPTKLVLLSMTDNNYPALDKHLLEKFHQENPDIVIEVINKGSHMNVITTYLVAGQQLDIAVLNPCDVISLGTKDLLVDLDKYVQSEKRFENWYKPSLNAFRTEKGLWGIPRDMQLPGVFYNTDAFALTGLKNPSGKWTYDDLKKAANRLNKKDDNGSTTRWGWKFPTWRNWVPIIWNYGADFYDNWAEPKSFIGNTPEMYNALHYLQSLVESEAILDKTNHAKWGVQKAFMSQTAAMVTTNTFVMGQFKQITDFEWDVAPSPYGPSGRKNYFNGLGWFTFKTCKNYEAAWRFINFVTNEYAMEAMINILGTVPPDRRYQGQWLAKMDVPINKRVLFEDIETAGYPGSLETSLYSLVEKEVLSAMWGETTIVGAIENMQKMAEIQMAELKNQ